MQLKQGELRGQIHQLMSAGFTELRHKPGWLQLDWTGFDPGKHAMPGEAEVAALGVQVISEASADIRSSAPPFLFFPIVAFVGSDKCEVRSYAVDRFTVTRYTDDVALLTYLATQDTTCYGKPVPRPSWTSSLYVRRNGKWQNALYQHSPAVQPPNGPQSAG